MPKKDFANTLKKKRIELGYNQSQVSDMLYLSRSTYNHFESGIRVPSIDTLLRISAIFKLNPMELIIPLIPEDLKQNDPEYFSAIIQANQYDSPKDYKIIQGLNQLNISEKKSIENIIFALQNHIYSN